MSVVISRISNRLKHAKPITEVLQAVKVNADYTRPPTPPIKHPLLGSVYLLASVGRQQLIFPSVASGSFSNYTCMKPSKHSLKPKQKSALAFMPNKKKNPLHIKAVAPSYGNCSRITQAGAAQSLRF